jgi:DNA-binding CsgD family transcriptional regulator/tetratricopeptide (TPR) repeat protein
MALLEREPFLGRLADMLMEARHGRGHLALVVGEAGIGKTSLVEEFCGMPSTRARTYWGTCDPLVPPRPFTPILDIAERVGGDLRRGLADGDRDAVFEAFLALVRRMDGPPAVVVFDDLHWADEATLDLLQAVGRRVGRLPTLVIGTYRDHEVGHDHALRMALGEVPARSMTEIRLPPLSLEAVRQLAGHRQDASALFEATAGNPFFVTETLAADGDQVATTVRDAVLRRVSQLTPPARHVIEAASVLGPGCVVATLLDVAGERQTALDECTAHALLQLVDGAVSFRHELARQAVLDALAEATRSELHAAALRVLRAPAMVDWPRLARHAIGAHDTAAVLELAPLAGMASEALGAHRQAAAFYGAALQHGDVIESRPRAELLERYATESSLADDVLVAIDAQRIALEIWRTLGDRLREGTCLTTFSLKLWLAGSGPEAMVAAREAAHILETEAPDSIDLARAWAVLAQRQVVAAQDGQAIDSAGLALDLAERLGDERIAVHALTSSSCARIFSGDEGGWSSLEEAVVRGRAANLTEDTARALINLVEAARDLRRYHLADRYLRDAIAYLDDHEVGLYHHILRSRIADLELEAGNWDTAVAHAESLLDLGRLANPIRVRALTIIGLVRARRAEPGAWDALDEALELTGQEQQELAPLRVARAESAWLDGDDGHARDEAARGLELGQHDWSPWWWTELAFWAWKAGAVDPRPGPAERPYWLHSHGRYREAAAAWDEIGAPYQVALALADSDAETDLRRALAVCNTLGARALGRRITERLRRLGAVRIERGPRPATRANPRQLTGRQLEVLRLIAAGHSNAEIADLLVISPKTVDHHVSAILRKLEVPDRTAAAEVAARLGLSGWGGPQDGVYASPR